MIVLVPILALFALGWFFPRFTIVLITGPITGVAFGGAAWVLAAAFSKEFVSLESLGMFILCGMAFMTLYFLKDLQK
jgi:hypothetical protein